MQVRTPSLITTSFGDVIPQTSDSDREGPPPAGFVGGRTLASLVSPGTELATIRARVDQPTPLGYAAVMQIDEVGEGVDQFEIGQNVFCFGPHARRQLASAEDVIAVPTSLEPSVAVFARMMAVSWTTLVTTRARPNARVLITGLGIVGNLAAQIFSSAGYEVVAVDPSPVRRNLASGVGIERTYSTVDEIRQAGLTVSLVVDCSGHEGAVVDGIGVTVQGGEVVLVGVPWEPRTDIQAHAVFHAVFHRYVTIRSGWEWELPLRDRAFTPGSIHQSIEGALRWLDEGRVRTTGLAMTSSPSMAPSVYEGLPTSSALTALFDWT